MNLTPQSVAGLKRHLLGALSLPSRIWLEPVLSPRLSFASAPPLRISGDDCLLDLGRVASPGTERRTIRVRNRGWKQVRVRIIEVPPWIDVKWRDEEGSSIGLAPGSAGADLAFMVEHDVVQETNRRGAVELQVEEVGGATSTERISVHFAARPTRAVGVYDFNGQPEPREFEFERNGAYVMSFGAVTSVPLTVSFADLPSWLTFTVDGRHRHGPIAGRFFERTAPFRVVIHALPIPDGSGSEATVRMHTNDARLPFQSIELRFRRLRDTQATPVTSDPFAQAREARPLSSGAAFAIVAALVFVLFTWLFLSMQGVL